MKRIRLCYVFLSLCWTLLLLVATPSHGTTMNMSPIGGYLYGVKLYADAAALGADGCQANNGTLARIESTPAPTRGGPDIAIYCNYYFAGYTPPNQVTRWAGFSYTVQCATGSLSQVNGTLQCVLSSGYTDKPCQRCPSANHGNPINLISKEKLQSETDFDNGGELEFTRFYRSASRNSEMGDFSLNWRHSYSLHIFSNIGALPLKISYYLQTSNGYEPSFPAAGAMPYAFIRRPDGSALYFQSTDGGISWMADSDINYKLQTLGFDSGGATGWKLTSPNNEIEIYDAFGQITSLRRANGRTLSFTYSDETTPQNISPLSHYLIAISDEFGHTIHLVYDSQKRVSSMTTPAGNTYTYVYDGFGNLSSVTAPDGLSKYYYYNEPAYQLKTGAGNDHLLTGISYELSSGVVSRYAIFRYDTAALPVSTEHAGGVEKYLVNTSAMKVTDPLGAVHQYLYTTVNGAQLQSYESKPTATGSAWSTIQYDANSNFSAITNFNGSQTTFVFDLTRNLETSRTEGASTAYARTITTEWHPTMRLPARIAEGKRITTYSYDAAGLLLTKSIQATTDATGSLGFSATLVGAPQVWQYTYNQYGQVLTVKGPRTDVDDTRSYTYDGNGNLATATNALHHQTSYSDYDGDGRVRTITDPNGRVTYLTYSLRGLLESRTVAGERTSFTYNGADKLMQISLPDNSTINYSYDDAQRLIGATDSLGNSISYTLDALGGRTAEQVKDPGGILSRNITRVFDSMGQMTQKTGGVQ